MLDKHLIPAANSGESKVFYYKMYVINLSKCIVDVIWLYGKNMKKWISSKSKPVFLKFLTKIKPSLIRLPSLPMPQL